MKNLFAFVFFLFSLPLVSQDMDSLDILIKSVSNPKAKADSLCKIGWDIIYQDLGRAYDFFVEAESISKEVGYKFGIGNAQNRLGTIYYMVGIPDTAMMYYRSSLKIFKEINNQDKIGSLYLNMGNVFSFIGETDSSYSYTVKSLEVFTELEDVEAQSLSLGNLGNYYQQMGVYEKALDYYYMALEIEDSLGDERSLASTYNNIAIVTWALENYNSAEDYLRRALKVWEKEKNTYNLATAYLNMGGIFQDTGIPDSARHYTLRALSISKKTGDVSIMSKALTNLEVQYELAGIYDSAKYYGLKALSYFKETEDKAGQLTALINLTSLYQKLGLYQEGLEFANTGIGIALELEDYQRLAKLHRNKSILLSKLGRYKEAFENAELFADGIDSIQSHNLMKALHELQVKYETEEKDMRINSLNQENQLQAALVDKKELEIQQGKLLRNLLSVVAVLLIFAAAAFYRSFRIKKKANLEISEKNEELNAQNEEIMAQRDQLEEQNRVIGEKNRQITDSINYAERIQKAMLPSSEKLKDLFPENFVLYKPRDIVSGDFFWVGETETHKVLVVADCTGHGVPGAFMSMIGMELLNRIISQEGESDPGKILNALHSGVNKALKQDKTEVRDGMDVVVLSCKKNGSDFLFSGAKNSLLFVSEEKLETIKGDKFPIGGHSEEGERNFKTHQVPATKGSSLYLFTDGIPDQFGGPSGKKFMIKRLKELLLNNSSLNIQAQQDNLADALEQWMKGYEQVDDICIIGIKF